MKSLLAIPIAYRAFTKAIGGGRSRGIFVTEYLKPRVGDRVLDIGCGDASILDYLPQVEYTGFDTNSDYISAAIKRYGNRGSFFCKAATQEAIEEAGTFDITLAIGVLHHLTDAESTGLFELAMRALKNQGRLVTFDGCYTPHQSSIARYLLRSDRGKFVRTPDQYLAMAKQYFHLVNGSVREDLLLIPYSHFIMDCVKA